ncbi:MAG TPA: AbgT family transporter, partial [Bacteroidales bacterium]|nr:AbgT family transporter [Bacteroidales bacterium]
ITFGMIAIVLVIFSVNHVQTPLKIGNVTKSAPVIPILTALFMITGFISLRKSVHFFILVLLLFTILFLIVGVMGYQWFIMEIATLFFVMGILAGMAFNNSPNKIVKLFLEGVKDIIPAAMVVGLAGGIIVILEDGNVIDTILYRLSMSMESMGKVSTVGMMYVIQTIINIAIPSGSAKAALTMPIMAPFSDLVGLSRQATVMAYQFGDGFTNMITPTSGVLIGVLGIARIPYTKWVRWVTPLMIILILLGFIMLIPTVTMSLPGF